MAEPIEELEPLFDYTRVQPQNVICLEDDDSDSSPVPTTKRRKTSNYVGSKNEKDRDGVELVNCEDDEEEDWLRPPPKASKVAQNMCVEDSTIKELRLKKQELVSFALSAEKVLQTVEESVKRDICNTVQNFSETSTDCQEPKPSLERPRIVISIQDKDGPKQFRVFMDEKFERLFKMYSDKIKIDLQKLVFCFDGDRLSPSDTPDSIGLDDDDIIEVHIK